MDPGIRGLGVQDVQGLRVPGFRGLRVKDLKRMLMDFSCLPADLCVGSKTL